MKTINFKKYVAMAGYKATKVWKNQEGYYARIDGYVSKPDPHFTQVLSGGTVVRLSLKDVDNPQIVGKDVKVVFESKSTTIRDMVREILAEMEDEELEEVSTTGNVSGYNTPNAFKKTDGTDENDKPDAAYIKRISTGTGYTQVNEVVKQGKRYGEWTVTHYQPVAYDDLGSPNGGRIRLVNQNTMDVLLIQNDLALRNNKWWVSTKGKKVVETNPEVAIQKAVKLNEGTNRYHQLRKSEGTPNQKIGVGIRELRTQLSEMEKFVTWYGKIKNESGLDSSNYWKRTQRHLTKIRERIDKLSQKIRELSV